MAPEEIIRRTPKVKPRAFPGISLSSPKFLKETLKTSFPSYERNNDIINSIGENSISESNVDRFVGVTDEGNLIVREAPQYFANIEIARQLEEKKKKPVYEDKIEEEEYEYKEVKVKNKKLLESGEKFRIQIGETENTITYLVFRINAVGVAEARVISKMIEPGIKAIRKLKEVAVKGIQISDTEAMKKLSEADIEINVSQPRVHDISEKIISIKERSSSAISAGKKIADISQLDELEKSVIAEVLEKALKGKITESTDKMDAHIKKIDRWTETLYKVARKIRVREEISKDLLEVLPRKIRIMIKEKSETGISASRLANYVEKIAEWMQSSGAYRKFKDLDDRLLPGDKKAGKEIVAELEEEQARLNRFLESRDKLVESIKKKDSKGILNALKEMKKQSPTTELKKRIANLRDAYSKLIIGRRRIGKIKNPKKKQSEKKELVKQREKFFKELGTFLGSMGALHAGVLLSVRDAHKTFKAKEFRKILDKDILGLLTTLRGNNRSAAYLENVQNKSLNEFLRTTYKEVRSRENELTEEDYAKLFRNEMRAFLSRYPGHLSSMDRRFYIGMSSKKMEEELMKLVKEEHRSAGDIRSLLLRIPFEISLANFREEIWARGFFYKKLCSSLKQGKIKHSEFVRIVNRLRMRPPEMETEFITTGISQEFDADWNSAAIREYGVAVGAYTYVLRHPFKTRGNKEIREHADKLFDGIMKLADTGVKLAVSLSSKVEREKREFDYGQFDYGQMEYEDLVKHIMVLYKRSAGLFGADKFSKLFPKFRADLDMLAINGKKISVDVDRLTWETEDMMIPLIAQLPPDQREGFAGQVADYLFEKGRYKEAIREYTKLIKKTPENPWLWYSRARSYEALGSNEKMLADIEGMSMASDNFVEKFGRYRIEKLKEAAELHPKREKELLAMAIETCDTLLAKSYDLGTGGRLRYGVLKGWLQYRLGDPGGTIETLNNSEKLCYDSNIIYYFSIKGKTPEEKYLISLIGEAFRIRAYSFYDLGEYDLAQKEFEEAKKRGAITEGDSLEELIKAKVDFMKRFPRVFRSRKSKNKQKKDEA